MKPIQSFNSIRDFYLAYLETAFRIRHEEIQKLRRELLEKSGTLTTEPFLEPIPHYQSCGYRVNDLCDVQIAKEVLPNYSQDEIRAFARLVLSGLLPAKDSGEEDGPASGSVPVGAFEIYSHQLEMLRRGSVSGKPGIVTSGTGSGKTEAFLLPVFAALAKEAKGWSPSPGLNEYEPWWQSPESNWSEFKKTRPGQHPTDIVSFLRDKEHAERPKAVRALILYPMNALVEDQLVRLRKALDSPNARKVMNEEFSGNRIFFGRYTGQTPVTQWRQHPRLFKSSNKKQERDARAKAARKVEDLWEWCNAANETHSAALNELRRQKKAGEEFDPDLPYNFPQVDGAEMTDRWSIQKHPPDLLITNTSMLSAMMVREVDEPIWNETRRWLESDPNSYFYLVLDELHLQRGTAGTEVSFLIRSLLHKLGLDQDEHKGKLRILASSASLPMEKDSKEQSLDYLWDMFGTNGHGSQHGGKELWTEAVIGGGQLTYDRRKLETPDPERLNARTVDLFEELSDSETLLQDKKEAWEKLAETFGIQVAGIELKALALKVVDGAGGLLASVCAVDGNYKARSPSQIAEKLFGDGSQLKAIENLASLRSLSDQWQDQFGEAFSGTSPNFRMHVFLRAIEGLFAAPAPTPAEKSISMN